LLDPLRVRVEPEHLAGDADDLGPLPYWPPSGARKMSPLVSTVTGGACVLAVAAGPDEHETTAAHSAALSKYLLRRWAVSVCSPVLLTKQSACTLGGYILEL
jgi:hypothetical protein